MRDPDPDAGVGGAAATGGGPGAPAPGNRAGTRRLLLPRLRPAPGRRLPRELRPARVGRLAAALPGGLFDPGFPALLSRIDQGPIHPANPARVYTSGSDAFAAMRDAIEAARREVLVEAYVFRDDGAGRAVLEWLGAAAARGVRVRVLADAFGSIGTRRRFWREMERRGVEVRLFHRLFRRPWYQPFRDHRKLLVADRRVGFTGGMNIGEEYGGSPTASWRDTAVRVEGSAAWELALVFTEGWRRAGGTPPDLGPAELAVAEEAAETRVLVLDSRPGRGHAESASVLAAILGAARRRVWITTAYFSPGRLAVSLLERTARRGVDVRLLLPGRTDVPVARHAGHAFFGRLLCAGVRIWEYGPAVLHAKTLVADGGVSVAGSSNIDIRSFRFNAECNLVLIGEGPARELETAFQEDLLRSREIRREEWTERGALHRLGDSAARLLVPVL